MLATFALVASRFEFILANPYASAVAGVLQVIDVKSLKTPPFIAESVTKSVDADGSALLAGKEPVTQVCAPAKELNAASAKTKSLPIRASRNLILHDFSTSRF